MTEIGVSIRESMNEPGMVEMELHVYGVVNLSQNIGCFRTYRLGDEM
jgi:hypothetical protein